MQRNKFTAKTLTQSFCSYLPDFQIDLCYNGEFWQARVMHPPEGKHLSACGLTEDEALSKLKEQAFKEFNIEAA